MWGEKKNVIMTKLIANKWQEMAKRGTKARRRSSMLQEMENGIKEIEAGAAAEDVAKKYNEKFGDDHPDDESLPSPRYSNVCQTGQTFAAPRCKAERGGN